MERVPILQERLMLVRRRRGLSQDQVAQQAQLFKTDVSKYERGVSVPTVGRLVRLADVLDVSVDYLLGRCEEMTHA